MKPTQAKVQRVRPAGRHHQVVTVRSEDTFDRDYCKRPCADCPWRKDAVGLFPSEAFRHSAETAYDLATHTFACHASGVKTPRICAGLLLHGAHHNLAVRLNRIRGRIREDIDDGGHALFESYRQMAVANGVDPDDPVLALCR